MCRACLPREKQATIADLAGRAVGRVPSGGQRRAARGCGSTMGDPPARGSVAPGTLFPLQQLGLQCARHDLRAGRPGRTSTTRSSSDLASADAVSGLQPRASSARPSTPARSVHPAYHFYLRPRATWRGSGYLMLRDGDWAGDAARARALGSGAWSRPPSPRSPRCIRPSFAAGPFGYGYSGGSGTARRTPAPYRGRVHRHRRGGTVHYGAAGARHGRRAQDAAGPGIGLARASTWRSSTR